MYHTCRGRWNMITHWEEFQFGPTPPNEERLHVTLNPKHVILLNGNMYEKLGSPEAVVLLFDKLNSVIGVNPVPKTKSNAFPLTSKTKGRQKMIRAAPFCRHHNIKVEKTTAFINADVDEDGVLWLDLKKPKVITKKTMRNYRTKR